jgi:hypothetical protein
MTRFLEVKTSSGSIYHFCIDEDEKEGFQDKVQMRRIGKAGMSLLMGKHQVIEDNTWYLLEGEFEEPEIGRSMEIHVEGTETISTTNVKEIIDKSEQYKEERFLDP